MARLFDCDRQLTALIQTEANPNYSWDNLFFDFVDSYNLTLANKPHTHNTSYAWTNTDHISREKDTLALKGTIACRKNCSQSGNDNYFNIEEEVKYFKERMLHNRKTLAIITLSTGFIFRQAVLVSASIDVNNDKIQEKMVNLVFHGYNFSGSTYQPDTKIGGVYSERLGFPII